MQKKLLFLTFSFLYILPTFAQDLFDFKVGKSYSYLLDLSNKNKAEALYLADSLYVNANSRKEVIEAKMISAAIFEKNGDYKAAISSAFAGLNNSLQIKESFSEATILLVLAKQFRNIGYSVHGDKFIAQAEKIISSLPLENAIYRLKGELVLEKGELDLEEQKYEDAIYKFKLADFQFSHYLKNEDLKNLYLARNEYLLGTSYYHLKQFNKSFKHFDKSYRYTQLSDPNGKISRAWIYNGYANLYLELNDLYCSEFYFQKSLRLAENTECNLTKKYVYKDALKFYKLKNDLDSITVYSAKYISILTSINRSQKGILQSEVWRNEAQFSEGSQSTMIYLGIGAVAVIGFVSIFNKTIFQNNFFKNGVNESIPEADKTLNIESYLPEATELSLLVKLDEFEKKKKFLNNNMCISRMATQIQTNVKYLRYILKKHKQSDYSTYINDLRVSYIIEKINSDPTYLKYKISYLAEEAGFSSHSKFSKTFKKLTNYSPSEYIGKIKSVRT